MTPPGVINAVRSPIASQNKKEMKSQETVLPGW